MQRLDKFLCDSGAGTRSQVKAILKSGRVSVDGAVEKDGARKLAPENHTVCVDGEVMGGWTRRVLLLHKTAGFVTATEDAREETVMALLPPEHRDLKPVGRLDKETEGLLLFTNDGDLLHRLISPKKEVPKRYYARHEGQADQADVEAFRLGLTLGDGTLCRSALLEPLGAGESMVTVCEGKYHQVRRMLASRGMPVTYLRREQEGQLTLGTLAPGAWRLLSEEEIRLLENCAE